MKSWKSLGPRCASLIWKIWFLYLGNWKLTAGGLGKVGEGGREGRAGSKVGWVGWRRCWKLEFFTYGEETLLERWLATSFYFVHLLGGSKIQVDYVIDVFKMGPTETLWSFPHVAPDVFHMSKPATMQGCWLNNGLVNGLEVETLLQTMVVTQMKFKRFFPWKYHPQKERIVFQSHHFVGAKCLSNFGGVYLFSNRRSKAANQDSWSCIKNHELSLHKLLGPPKKCSWSPVLKKNAMWFNSWPLHPRSLEVTFPTI